MTKYEVFRRILANLKEGAETKEPYSVVEQVGLAKLFDMCFILIPDYKVYKKSSKISHIWILRRFFVYTLMRD